MLLICCCCFCCQLLLAAFSTKTDYVFRKTRRFLRVFEFLSGVQRDRLVNQSQQCCVICQSCCKTRTNCSRDLVFPRGQVFTYHRVCYCGWLFFIIHLSSGFGFFPSTTIGHLENLFKLITKCCCFLHSVTYFQAWGVCPECNKISLSRIYIENVPGFSFWRSTRNGQSSRMYPELIILSTSYVEYFSKPEFVV